MMPSMCLLKVAKPSWLTDITRALLQAAEYFNEKYTDQKTALIYSDLQEELPDELCQRYSISAWRLLDYRAECNQTER